jgi:hypothetical protein
MPNAIDLTTTLSVKSWAGLPILATDQDQTIQDAITAFSALVLRMTGRGPLDGTIPPTSPFITPVAYDDVLDGSGTMRQPIRNWPITAVSSVQVNGQTIPQSTSVNITGWVVDGDKRFISLRGGLNPTVATFQNYRYQRGYGNLGPGFSAGIQNVEIQYTAGFASLPYDLEMTARKVVARYYKRRGWIGLRQQAMAAGAGTVTYDGMEMAPDEYRTIMYYKAYFS